MLVQGSSVGFDPCAAAVRPLPVQLTPAGNRSSSPDGRVTQTRAAGCAALCITGETRSFLAIQNAIGSKVISPMKKYIGSSLIDVFLVTSSRENTSGLTEATFQAVAKTWGTRYARLVRFDPAEAAVKRFAHMVQFLNLAWCAEAIFSTSAAYRLVGKTRTDILPLEEFELPRLHTQQIVGCHSYPFDAFWIREFGRPFGDMCAFGGPEEMQIYFAVMRYFFDLQDHRNVTAPLRGPTGTEYYLYNNLLFHGISVISSPKFTKVVLENGRPIERKGTMKELRSIYGR